MTRLCEVPNCGGKSVSHGLCDKHRLRLQRHGDLNHARPVGWGGKASHPLYDRWRWMGRDGGRSPAWGDFWTFVQDVGAPPEGQRLFRIDTKVPWSKSNVEWRPPILDAGRRSDMAKYQRAYRMKRPHIARKSALQNYGLTLEQFEAMLAAQGGVCAICCKPEFAKHQATGEVRNLAVDHNHETGATRGLLCTNCNKGLGHFQDDLDLLKRAIAYLESHQAARAA